MVRLSLCLVTISCLLILSSCTDQLVKPEDYSFVVSSPMKSYALTMSSVPGLPIESTCDILAGDVALEVHYFCTQGSFIGWSNGELQPLSDSVYQPFRDHEIYWSPMNNQGEGVEENQSVEVHIDVLNKTNGMIVESSMHMIYALDSMYRFDQLPQVDSRLKVYDLLEESDEKVKALLFDGHDLKEVDWEDQVFYFTDEFLATHQAADKDMATYISGSLLLKSRGPMFQVELDEQVIYKGYYEHGPLSSFLPVGIIMEDRLDAVHIGFIEMTSMSDQRWASQLYDFFIQEGLLD